jgi:hypothetical protein
MPHIHWVARQNKLEVPRDKAVMPCTSARALHVQMCSEFTALGHVQ